MDTPTNGADASDPREPLVQPSRYDLPTTIERIVQQAEQHGAHVFAVIDHAAAAESVGLRMPPTTVVVFGNPAVGTHLMLATPDIALDLPSRVLVRQVGDRVEVVQTPAAAIAARYGIPSAEAAGLAKLQGMLDAALA